MCEFTHRSLYTYMDICSEFSRLVRILFIVQSTIACNGAQNTLHIVALSARFELHTLLLFVNN